MTSKEAAREYGTTTAMIRYYARVGLIPSPKARNGKERQYTKQECDLIELIESMSAAGMSIHEIADYIAMSNAGADARAMRSSILDERHARLMAKSTRLARMVARIEREMEKST